MKISFIALGVLLVGVAVAFAMSDVYVSGTWRYKMTVVVETPEGEISGSAVRQMGNDTTGSFIPEVGNPADVSGEAVVVDLGERGKLFALISHRSDLEFYDTFPVPGGKGGATPEAIKYYASLPVGTKGVLDPGTPAGYPKLVTFTDMNDATSVTLVQEWKRNRDSNDPRQQWTLVNDRMEELFGDGVKLKEITLEITDEPKTKSGILEDIPKFDDGFWKWRKTLSFNDLRKISGANFSKGSIKEFRKGMSK